jgi:magnesium transporter
MKTLTLHSSVILPMTFVAGVYGMNFEHMPELGWVLGYPMSVLMMLGSSLAIWIVARRAGWL